MHIHQQIEELLERVWTAREHGTSVRQDLDGEALGFDVGAALGAAQGEGLLTVRAGRLALTPAGDERAARVIRRHRLAERLLSDVIRVDDAAMEAVACELEHTHILSEDATDRVCAFLGHPPTCPHDRPIPRGACCETVTREVRPLVHPLIEGSVGAEYRIVFIASRSHRRLERLCMLGVVPGAVLRLEQQSPAFVVKLGETELALEREVAADVFVLPR
jgi:DtxR family Mn-dependent transcriptional regulator